jgi:hypothetical protein
MSADKLARNEFIGGPIIMSPGFDIHIIFKSIFFEMETTNIFQAGP